MKEELKLKLENIENKIIEYYKFAIEKSDKPGWVDPLEGWKERFSSSVPAVALLLLDSDIELGDFNYNDDYYVICLKNEEEVGKLVLKTDHLELRYTNKYNFNNHQCAIDSVLVSRGNTISGVLSELLSETTSVQTEFNENGIMTYAGFKPYESYNGIDRIKEVITYEQIAYNFAQEKHEKGKQY